MHFPVATAPIVSQIIRSTMSNILTKLNVSREAIVRMTSNGPLRGQVKEIKSESSDETVEKIRKAHASGVGISELARRFKLGRSTIYRLL